MKGPGTIDTFNVSCPLCRKITYLYCNYSDIAYYYCKQCKLLFLHPLPTIEKMKNYAEEQYISGVYTDYTKARDLKVATFQRRMTYIKRFISKGKLLDLGCSCGFMLEVAVKEGFDAYGIEFSEAAIKSASPDIQSRIYHRDINNLNNFDNGKFDVITAFDILEHMLNPLESISRWSMLLNPGGIIVISSPDTDSSLRWIMGCKWPMLQPFQHTFLFSKSHFNEIFSKLNLVPLETISIEKVITVEYLLGQVEIYIPFIVKIGRFIGKLFPFFMRRAIPLRIGEFLTIGKKLH